MSRLARFFLFEYITEDERLLQEAKTVYLDPKKTRVKGVLTKPGFDQGRRAFYNMTGFFLESDGIEYGSISVTPSVIYDILTKCGCRDRLHSKQFSIQFN
jgi:hypothetical protein